MGMLQGDLEMIGEPDTQRDQGQRWIDGTRSRINRRASDVQISQPMDFTVRIDDALLRIRAHPRRPHVVPAAADETRPGEIVAQQPILDLHAAGVGASHLAAE